MASLWPSILIAYSVTIPLLSQWSCDFHGQDSFDLLQVLDKSYILELKRKLEFDPPLPILENKLGETLSIQKNLNNTS